MPFIAGTSNNIPLELQRGEIEKETAERGRGECATSFLHLTTEFN